MEFLGRCRGSHENTMVLSPRRVTEWDISSISDGPKTQDRIHLRKFTPEFNSDDLDNDLYICRPNNLSEIQWSRETTNAKTHVLELGAGLLQKDDRPIPFRDYRMRPTQSTELNLGFFDHFDALASV